MTKLKCIATVGCLMMLWGCTPTNKRVQPPDQKLAASESSAALIPSTDPCAMHLHDISGAFIQYIFLHNDLPPKLDDLTKLADEELVYVCPESKKPYIYAPGGILLPDKQARIILYDPAASHNGYRQAIAITEPEDGKALMTKVIALPESFFLLHPPEKSAENEKK